MGTHGALPRLRGRGKQGDVVMPTLFWFWALYSNYGRGTERRTRRGCSIGRFLAHTASQAMHAPQVGCAVRGRNVVLSGPFNDGLLPFLPSLNEI